VAALTEHLRRVDRDPELLRRLQREALGHSTQLTWSAAAEELARAYREGLDRFGRHMTIGASAKERAHERTALV
jgi:hypothetical protein